jgi:hypothetical protein
MEYKSPCDPYIAKDLDNELRLEWRKANLLDDNGPIRKVAVVGGIVNGSNRLYTPDHQHLTAIVRALKKAGKPLGTGFAISWYNLLPPMKNDFLHAALSPRSNTPDTDALILLGLPKQGERGWLKNPRPYGEDIDRQVMDDYINTYNMIIVSRLSGPGIWADAAIESGAKVVATWGGRGDELSSEAFEKDWRRRFTILKPTGPQASLSSWGDEAIGIAEPIPAAE